MPREWRHPDKDVLDAWYRRLGFAPIGRRDLLDVYPRLAPQLATPSDLHLYAKTVIDRVDGSPATTG